MGVSAAAHAEPFVMELVPCKHRRSACFDCLQRGLFIVGTAGGEGSRVREGGGATRATEQVPACRFIRARPDRFRALTSEFHAHAPQTRSWEAPITSTQGRQRQPRSAEQTLRRPSPKILPSIAFLRMNPAHPQRPLGLSLTYAAEGGDKALEPPYIPFGYINAATPTSRCRVPRKAASASNSHSFPRLVAARMW